MSQAHIDTIQAAYEAFNRGDWEDMFAAAPPDFELRTADRVTNPGTYRGREEARRFFEDLFEPFEEVVVEAEGFFETDGQIVVFIAVRSRPTGSSAVVENRIAHLWTFRGDDVAGLQIFPERDKALAAIGVAEPGSAPGPE
jgi:ketosteroid isomerase-like protein